MRKMRIQSPFTNLSEWSTCCSARMATGVLPAGNPAPAAAADTTVVVKLLG